jgi:hypothetical protein
MLVVTGCGDKSEHQLIDFTGELIELDSRFFSSGFRHLDLGKQARDLGLRGLARALFVSRESRGDAGLSARDSPAP